MRNLPLYGSLIGLVFIVACGSARPTDFFGDGSELGGTPTSGSNGTPLGTAGSGGSSGGSVGSAGTPATGEVPSVSGGTSSSGDTGGSDGSGANGGTGNAPEAGSGGTGGSTSSVAVEVIDDLEDGNLEIPAKNGRVGSWNKFNDGKSADQAFTNQKIPTGRASSTRAIRTTGSGYYLWGAAVGLTLNHASGAEKKAYDASAFRGITFWARSAKGSREVVIQVPDSHSAPESNLCIVGTTCYDHFLTKRTVSEAWAQYFISFDELYREGNQLASVLDKARIYSIEFLVRGSPSFELWIDDVGFTK